MVTDSLRFTAARYIDRENAFLLTNSWGYSGRGGSRTVRVGRWRLDGGAPEIFYHTDELVRYLMYKDDRERVKPEAMAFSEDGKQVLLARGDSAVLYDLGGKWLAGVRDAGGRIKAVALSPDGKRLVTGADSGALLWETKTATARQLPNTNNTVFVSFAHDNKHLLTASPNISKEEEGCDVRIWNDSGREVFSLNLPSLLKSAVYAPDSKSLLLTTVDSTLRFDYASPENDGGFTVPGKAIAATFSPNGRQFLVGFSNNAIKLWDVDNPQPKAEFGGHTGPVTALAFSPDGKTILTGSRDKTARLWTLDGTPLMVFKGHVNELNYVGFSEDGSRIFTGAADGTVREWVMPTTEFRGHLNAINLVAVSPDGDRLLTGSVDTTAILWDKSGRIRKKFPFADQVASVAFSPDNRLVAAASQNSAWVWAKDDTVLREFSGHTDVVQALLFSPGSNKLLTASDDNRVILWNVKDGRAMDTLLQEAGVVSLAFTPDGSKVLTGNRNGEIFRWSLQNKDGHRQRFGEKDITLRHGQIVYAIAVSPDGENFLTGSGDSTACLWNKNGVKLKTFSHGDEVESVAFSPDGTKFLTGSWDGKARVWSRDGTLLMTYSVPDKVRSVAFTPDSRNVFVGSADGIARLFRAQSIEEFFQRNEIGLQKATQMVVEGLWQERGRDRSLRFLLNQSGEQLLARVFVNGRFSGLGRGRIKERMLNMDLVVLGKSVKVEVEVSPDGELLNGTYAIESEAAIPIQMAKKR